MINKIIETAEDFGRGLMGKRNFGNNPATAAGKVTRKAVTTIGKGMVFFAKRNPATAIVTGTATALTGLFKGGNKLAEKLDTKMNEGQAEDTTDIPDYLNSKKSDYKEDYKNYWERTLGHKGKPTIEDFENLGDGYDPEVEFSQALRLYYDSKPL
tara:strand:+ start:4408 stop:4872 length:465 start_codon:yes stop_codon:yes gene_type:complete